jgi:hypothetical protein
MLNTKGTVLCAVALGATAMVAMPAYAAGKDDLATIRQEIKSLRSDYEKKIDELEQRLQDAEQRAKAAEAAVAGMPAAAPQPDPEPAAVRNTPVSASAFNPSISAVLNGTFTHVENDPAAAIIPGFPLDQEAGLPDRGFALGESELVLTANVDHVFSATLIAAIGSDNSIGIEEGFIQTTDLPWGLTVKAGRFFSGVGYLNERHAHNWDFMDQSLPYRAFLGGQLGDDGFQVQWLAPTDFFLQFGAEWLRGDSFPAGNADDNGAGTIAAFARTGGDLDEESSWLASLSYLKAKSTDRDMGGDIFNGDDQIGIASLVYKWAPNGNPSVSNLILNGEFFLDRMEGDFNGNLLELERTGWYVQGVYQFMPQWRFGLRYSQLNSDGVDGALLGSALDDFGRTPSAATALLEYDTSEFGRLRVQYTHDDSDLNSNSQITAGYTMIIGPHGAHRF